MYLGHTSVFMAIITLAWPFLLWGISGEKGGPYFLLYYRIVTQPSVNICGVASPSPQAEGSRAWEVVQPQGWRVRSLWWSWLVDASGLSRTQKQDRKGQWWREQFRIGDPWPWDKENIGAGKVSFCNSLPLLKARLSNLSIFLDRDVYQWCLICLCG